MRISNTRGQTWSAESTLYTDVASDVRDPGITVLQDGTCLISFFKYDIYSESVVDTWSLKSLDATCTAWGSPVRVSTNSSAESAPPVQLENGLILLPTYGYGIQVYQSTDNAATWSLLKTIDTCGSALSCSEPIIATRSDGTLIMTIRDYPVGYTGVAFSTASDPRTWSQVVGGIFPSASRAAIIESANGALIASYRTNNPYDLANGIGQSQMGIVLSYDGLSWTPEITTDVPGSGWFVYSAVTQLDANHLGELYCLQTVASVAFCNFAEVGVAGLPHIGGGVHHE
jgi:hypothetical protein